MALPWQADFNECTTQYVDVTFDTWNSIPTDTDQNPLLKREQRIWETLWWPAHRPVQVFEVTSNSGGSPTFTQLDWSRGIPTTNAGDLKMTTAWAQLGFVVLNPYLTPADAEQPTTLPPSYKYINVERNEG